MHPFLRYAAEHEGDMIRLLQEFVECESPSSDAGAVAHFVDLIVDRTSDIASTKVVRFKSSGPNVYGPHLRLEFKTNGRRKDGQILGLGHSDTVWPLGTLKSMPFRRTKGRLWGPGVLDMKAGLAFFIYAVRALRECDVPVPRRVVLLVVSDEEMGSETSRALTEKEAAKSKAVLVVEPGTGLEGKLKTSRKGVGDYTVRVDGVAAHAGVDFANGASAIVEMARQIETISTFTDLKRGITVNPGIVRGGTRTNVVAADAEVDVDIRVARLKDAMPLDRKFRALKPFDGRCRLTISGGLNRPPMERSPAIRSLFEQAQRAGTDLGLTIEESATGGGSDGNFTSALGIPTLDGLGGVGEGAHAPNESILIDRMADRVALLALMIQSL
jgi:glutamate carboxypeptidase